MKPITTKIGQYEIITARELQDNSTFDGFRKRQFRVRVMKNGKFIKSNYYLTQRDMEASVRMLTKVLETVKGEL